MCWSACSLPCAATQGCSAVPSYCTAPCGHQFVPCYVCRVPSCGVRSVYLRVLLNVRWSCQEQGCYKCGCCRHWKATRPSLECVCTPRAAVLHPCCVPFLRACTDCVQEVLCCSMDLCKLAICASAAGSTGPSRLIRQNSLKILINSICHTESKEALDWSAICAAAVSGALQGSLSTATTPASCLKQPSIC